MDVENLTVLMQLKKAMEEANPPAIPTPFDSTPEKPRKTGRIMKNCRFCKTTKFCYRVEWVNPPVIYEGCRNRHKIRYEPGKGDTLCAETKVFHGGGPGMGRRK